MKNFLNLNITDASRPNPELFNDKATLLNLNIRRPENPYFISKIFEMGYTDTIKLLSPEETFRLFETPIMKSKKLPKRNIAKSVKGKLSRIRKYNREIFIERARLIHGNSINYSRVTDINGYDANIPLICNICNYNWNPSVNAILSGKGCPSCNGALR